MYLGIKLYKMQLNQMEFKTFDETAFQYGDEISRIVYEAALCVRMQDGITFDKVEMGEYLLGGSKLYKVGFIVCGVKVEFIIAVDEIQLIGNYQWVVNLAVSRHEKITLFKNFMLYTIAYFNKAIRASMLNDF